MPLVPEGGAQIPTYNRAKQKQRTRGRHRLSNGNTTIRSSIHHGPYRPNERRDRKIFVNKDHITIVRQRGFALTHHREVPVAR